VLTRLPTCRPATALLRFWSDSDYQAMLFTLYLLASPPSLSAWNFTPPPPPFYSQHKNLKTYGFEK